MSLSRMFASLENGQGGVGARRQRKAVQPFQPSAAAAKDDKPGSPVIRRTKRLARRTNKKPAATRKKLVDQEEDKENLPFQTVGERRKVAKRQVTLHKSGTKPAAAAARKVGGGRSLASTFADIQKGKPVHKEEIEIGEEEDEEEVDPKQQEADDEDVQEEYEDEDENEEEADDEDDDDFSMKKRKVALAPKKTTVRPAKRGRATRRIVEEVSDEEDNQEDSDEEESELSDEDTDTAETGLDKIIAFRIVPGKGKSSSLMEFLVKQKGQSYLHLQWITKKELEDYPGGKQRLTRLFPNAEEEDHGELESHPLFMKDGEDPSRFYSKDCVTVDRIITYRDLDADDEEEEDEADETETKREFLVKWCGMSYEEATWEKEKDLVPEWQAKIEECLQRERLPSRKQKEQYERRQKMGRPSPSEFDEDMDPPAFKNGYELRDYQVMGLRWLTFCWYNKTNSILADEMGLGKTIQSTAILHYLSQEHSIRGPFLVIAPMSCLEQWRREMESWSDLNCVVFHGSAASRAVIRKYEWHYTNPAAAHKKVYPTMYKFEALLTTYEMILAEATLLAKIPWQYMIIDEGHRLKNRTSKLFEKLQCFKAKHKLILTGTPMQNHIEELWTMLHFLEPRKFASSQPFLAKFGNIKTSKQIKELHRVLAPYMLRRLKEDVEKSIPLKEETIIQVELSSVQKTFYRAILDKNREFLCRGVSARNNVPNLINIMMELRKCCNHPYLISGAEEKIFANARAREEATKGSNANSSAEDGDDELDLEDRMLIQSSAKLVLMDKLLSKLRQDGHKVLIFSQMVRLLDIIEDYLVVRGYPFERLDGGVKRSDRQTAIDRFSANKASAKEKDDDSFVFLLSTKAGGLGLNLTAADTVIIFDSDWNPQNDLQAQARCHRIGQTQNVKVYRLVTRNTYESFMLQVASKKLGLENAVMGTAANESDSEEEDAEDKDVVKSKLLGGDMKKEDIDRLLKYGAYDLFHEDEETQKESEKVMLSEDIESILQRSATVKVGEDDSAEDLPENEEGDGEESGARKQRARAAAAMRALSKVSYATSSADMDINMEDKDFWAKVLPEYKTAAGLSKSILEGKIKTEEQKKVLFADIEKLIAEVKEMVQSRSKSYAFSRKNPLMELSQLLSLITGEARNAPSELFSDDEREHAFLLQESLGERRARKPVYSNTAEDGGQEKAEKKATTVMEEEEESMEDKRLRLSGGWNKSQRNTLKSLLLQFGFGRFEEILRSSSLEKSKNVHYIRSMSECYVHHLLSSVRIGGTNADDGEVFSQVLVEDLHQDTLREMTSSDCDLSSVALKKKNEKEPAVELRAIATSCQCDDFYLPGQPLKLALRLPLSTLAEDRKNKEKDEEEEEEEEEKRDAKEQPPRFLVIDYLGENNEEQDEVRHTRCYKLPVATLPEEQEVQMRIHVPGFAGHYRIRCVAVHKKKNTLKKSKKEQVVLAEYPLVDSSSSGIQAFQVRVHPIVEEEKYPETTRKTWANRLTLMKRLGQVFAKYGTNLEGLQVGEASPKNEDSMTKKKKPSTLEVTTSGRKMPSLSNCKKPTWWWGEEDDHAMILGVWTHGYGKWKDICENVARFSEDLLQQRMQKVWNTMSEEEKQKAGKAWGFDLKLQKKNKDEAEEEEEQTKEEEEEEEEKADKKTKDPFAFPSVTVLNKRLERLIQELLKDPKESQQQQKNKRKREEEEAKEEKNKKKGSSTKKRKGDSDDNKKKTAKKTKESGKSTKKTTTATKKAKQAEETKKPKGIKRKQPSAAASTSNKSKSSSAKGTTQKKAKRQNK
ncbi:Chromodomain-helicase-DNA-binding protein 9 [Balamuthia mandrillaris]